MIALICDSWENFWREVLSPWGEIKTFSDGVTLAYYLQHGGPCDLAVVAVDDEKFGLAAFDLGAAMLLPLNCTDQELADGQRRCGVKERWEAMG